VVAEAIQTRLKEGDALQTGVGSSTRRLSLLNFATWSSLGGITPDAWINQQYAADTDKALGRGFVISRAYGSLQAGGYSKPNALATGPWADKRTTVHFTVDTSSTWATLSAEVGYTPGEDRHVGHQSRHW
jgi:hypothetical protein